MENSNFNAPANKRGEGGKTPIIFCGASLFQHQVKAMLLCTNQILQAKVAPMGIKHARRIAGEAGVATHRIEAEVVDEMVNAVVVEAVVEAGGTKRPVSTTEAVARGRAKWVGENTSMSLEYLPIYSAN